MREDITLNDHKQKRLLVLNAVVAGQSTVREAAASLALTERQVRRALSRYQEQGAAALAHGNRGRRPVHATDAAVGARVVALARTTYAGCNQQHLRDLLAEREGIDVSRATVHRLLAAAGVLVAPAQRPPQHRRRRDRRQQEGQLVQIDGSPHAWLDERGPRLTLLAAIDDATGKLLAAVFRAQEDAHGYFLLTEQLLRAYGRPLAFYHDRHSIFRPTLTPRPAPPDLGEQLAGQPAPTTQFGRLLQELEIASIAARSPQAKGRVERLFGTLQDRLVVELRLAAASNEGEANAFLASYLPRFNAQFAVPPAQLGTAYRPLRADAHLPLERVCCFKYARTVAADNTVTFGPQRLQIQPGLQRRSYAQAAVEVHERLDGSLAIVYAGEELHTVAAPPEAPRLRARGRPARASSGHDGVVPAVRREALERQGSGPAGRPSNVQAGPLPGPDHGPRPPAAVPAAEHPWRRPLYPPGDRRTKSLDS
ncbi:MAG: ISNCY family transposase [Ktedonobacterales bacterium]|nr:ISNCY family transposase [Ktedonobacterales bacterium]